MLAPDMACYSDWVNLRWDQKHKSTSQRDTLHLERWDHANWALRMPCPIVGRWKCALEEWWAWWSLDARKGRATVVLWCFEQSRTSQCLGRAAVSELGGTWIGTILKVSVMFAFESNVPWPASFIVNCSVLKRKWLRWNEAINAWDGARTNQDHQDSSFLCKIFSHGYTVGLVQGTGNGEDLNRLITYPLFASFSSFWEIICVDVYVDWRFFATQVNVRCEDPNPKSLRKTCEKVVYKHRIRVRRQFWCQMLNVYWCEGVVSQNLFEPHRFCCHGGIFYGVMCQGQTDRGWAYLQLLSAATVSGTLRAWSSIGWVSWRASEKRSVHPLEEDQISWPFCSHGQGYHLKQMCLEQEMGLAITRQYHRRLLELPTGRAGRERGLVLE